MVKHIFPDFLQDSHVYSLVEQYWIDLWQEIDSNTRKQFRWQQPWFAPLPPHIGEGNPIFSAVSPFLKRGVRIIQSEPTEKGLEFVAYPDTFGGSIFDSNTIHELVISCVLSDVAARFALTMMVPWVEGKSISFDILEGVLVTSNDRTTEIIYSEFYLPAA
jgi:hypothetical protein